MPAALHEVHKHEDKFAENAAQAGAVNEGAPSTTLLTAMVISFGHDLRPALPFRHAEILTLIHRPVGFQ